MPTEQPYQPINDLVDHAGQAPVQPHLTPPPIMPAGTAPVRDDSIGNLAQPGMHHDSPPHLIDGAFGGGVVDPSGAPVQQVNLGLTGEPPDWASNTGTVYDPSHPDPGYGYDGSGGDHDIVFGDGGAVPPVVHTYIPPQDLDFGSGTASSPLREPHLVTRRVDVPHHFDHMAPDLAEPQPDADAVIEHVPEHLPDLAVPPDPVHMADAHHIEPAQDLGHLLS
jgi:hypothetical protein